MASKNSKSPVIIDKIRVIQICSKKRENHNAATKIGCKLSSGTRKQKYSLKQSPPRANSAAPNANWGKPPIWHNKPIQTAN